MKKTIEDLLAALDSKHLIDADIDIEDQVEKEGGFHIIYDTTYLFMSGGNGEDEELAAATVLKTAVEAAKDIRVTVDELKAFRQLMITVDGFLKADVPSLAGKPLIEVIPELIARLKSALNAIVYAERRVQTDPDFRHYMDGTETLAKLVRAHSAITGEAFEPLMEVVTTDQQPAHRRRKADVLTLRQDNELLKQILDDHEIDWESELDKLKRKSSRPDRSPSAYSFDVATRVCDYAEVAHLVKMGHEVGLLTTDEPGTQWFCYDVGHETPIPLAVSAVKYLEQESAYYFCGSFTIPECRGKGYGEALMRLRVAYAVAQGAKRLLVYSLQPAWYLKHGWTQIGVRPSGALILEHTDPKALLESMGGQDGH